MRKRIYIGCSKEAIVAVLLRLMPQPTLPTNRSSMRSKSNLSNSSRVVFCHEENT